jgi:hypothetical protein
MTDVRHYSSLSRSDGEDLAIIVIPDLIRDP